jgi:hypothetical protein
MPSAERYAQYRADQTTIWVSKRAAEFLARERAAGESTASTVDRLLTELRAQRRGGASTRPAGGTGRQAGATRASTAGATSRGRGATKAAGRAGARAR